jgi:regulator of protease activity HflC (stomatin/prohibitin superfamily)
MLDWLKDLALDSLKAFQFWHVVHAYERAIVLRFGIYNRILEPGIHWIAPFYIEHVHFDSVVWRTTSLAAQSLTTADGLSVHVRAVVTARIKDVEKAWLDVEHVDHALKDSCAGEIGRVIAETPWTDLWHGKANDAITAACRRRGFRWGLEIAQVQLSDIALGKNLRLWTR